jgi:hypothetical protein
MLYSINWARQPYAIACSVIQLCLPIVMRTVVPIRRTRVLLRREVRRNEPHLFCGASLQTRSTGNPNVARRNNDELAGQFVSVLLQRLIQVLDLGLQLGPGKPEEQNTGVGKALVEDQLAEIPIRNDEDPLLLPGNRQDVLIRKAVRVIS